MSRGFGKVQLAILRYLNLTHGKLSLQRLAKRIYEQDGPATRAQLESVRRAVRKLNADGWVDVEYLRDDHGKENQNRVGWSLYVSLNMGKK